MGQFRKKFKFFEPNLICFFFNYFFCVWKTDFKNFQNLLFHIKIWNFGNAQEGIIYLKTYFCVFFKSISIYPLDRVKLYVRSISGWGSGKVFEDIIFKIQENLIIMI